MMASSRCDVCWCCNPGTLPDTIDATTDYSGGTYLATKTDCTGGTTEDICSTLDGLIFELTRVDPFKPCYKFLACSCSNNSNLSMGGRVVAMYKPTASNLLAITCGGVASNISGDYLIGPFKVPGYSSGGCSPISDCTNVYGVLDIRLYLMTRGGSNGSSTSGNGCDSGTLTYPTDHKCFWAFVQKIRWYVQSCSDPTCYTLYTGNGTLGSFTGCTAQINYFPTWTDLNCCGHYTDSPQVSFRVDGNAASPSCKTLPDGTADVSWSSGTGSGVSCTTAFANTGGSCNLSVSLTSDFICPPPPEEP